MAPWDEKIPGQKDAGQAILDALTKQFTSAQEMMARQTGPSPSPVVAPGSVPGAPSPNISFDPSGASGMQLQTSRPPQSMQFTPTGSQGIGGFPTRGIARNAGLTSLGNSVGSLITNIEQREDSKKAALAENYMLQINSLLASGDPGDRQKAMTLLEDPKIRKALKTGLEYVPIEEPAPPEAQGVQAAAQKIGSQGGQQPGQPQAQRMQPVLPQPSQQQKLQAAMTNALLQKIQQDPASAISMMGGSQLTGAEQRAAEFYEKGLGLSPQQTAAMSLQEKVASMKVYEDMMRDAMKMEVDMYKAQVGYQGKVEAAKVLANARKYWADTVKSYKTTDKKDGKQKPDAYAAGARMYEDMAKKYLDLSKQPNIKPEDKARYEQQANEYNQKADQYLNQQQDMGLMEDFMKAVEQGDTDNE